ncbi:hypothetical protein BJX64DRAFT_292701 [Aspergillus heterothallicus]
MESHTSSSGPSADATIPIAIIGIAGRFSQDATDADRFWDFLLQARQSSGPFPKERFNAEAYYHPDAEHGGTFHARGGHFLAENPNCFDAAFFRVGKSELETMDPVQRLVMENVYHALENAGIPIQKITGSNTSVYVGGNCHDHRYRLTADLEIASKHKVTGTENSVLSGRISWFYDLKGPSLTVDTACSSSLVALHLAAQSLRCGDSKMAIVSGANVVSYLHHVLEMSYSGYLSAEGKCFTFDHRANGYALGEGVATIIMKPLHDALRDGDTIRAVIRNTALNQDGRTPGLSHPNGQAQADLVRLTYARAGLDHRETHFVEAHGTGTAVGDPTETRAMADAFESATRGHPLYVGALKPNIGHLESACSVAGIVKLVHILEKAIIPANVNFEKINPNIHTEEWNLRLPTACMPWPAPGLRRVSINSFGLSGTNVHCILDDAHHYLQERKLTGTHNTRVDIPTVDEVATLNTKTDLDHLIISALPESLAPPTTAPDTPSLSKTPLILILSAFDQQALKRFIAQLAKYLSTKASSSAGLLRDLSLTLSDHRSRFRCSTFAAVSSIAELQDLLSNGALLAKARTSRVKPRLGFVFSGQGAQYRQMGLQLLRFPEFHLSLKQASQYFQKLGSTWCLLEELHKDEHTSQINEAFLSHPVCTALQVALVDLLRSWNLHPTRVVGHSSGEIAAAYCAERISREEAWSVAYHRGRTVYDAQSPVKGAMLAVGLGVTPLNTYLGQVRAELEGTLVIACFNSPSNHTVSGDETMIDRLKSLLDADKVFSRKLLTGQAYHSPHMQPLAPEYQRAMNRAELPVPVARAKECSVRLFSSSTGHEVSDAALDPSYWVHNLVSPVQFTAAVQKMCIDECGGDVVVDTLVELGPHSTLQSALKDILGLESGIAYLPTISRQDPSLKTTLNTAATLALTGYPVRVGKINEALAGSGEKTRILLDLPPYPFDHTRDDFHYDRVTHNILTRQHPRHDLFGAPVADNHFSHPRWRHFVRLGENPWLRDYMVDAEYVFPPAGFVVMGIEAVRQISSACTSRYSIHLKDVVFDKPLMVPDTAWGVETSLLLTPAPYFCGYKAKWWRFEVLSHAPGNDEWIEHCQGYLSMQEPLPSVPAAEVVTKATRCKQAHVPKCSTLCSAQHIDLTSFYSLAAPGCPKRGPMYQTMTAALTDGLCSGRVTADIECTEIQSTMPKNYTHQYLIHPTTLDGFFQVGAAAVATTTTDSPRRRGTYFSPKSVEDAWLVSDMQDESTFTCQAHVSPHAHESYRATIEAWGSKCEQPRMRMSGVKLTSNPRVPSQERPTTKPTVYSTVWKPAVDFVTTANLLKVAPPAPDAAMAYETERKRFEQLQLVSALLITDLLERGHSLLPVERRHARFYEFLKAVGVEVFADGVPHVPMKLWQKYAHSPDLKTQLYEQVSATDARGKLLVHMGFQLSAFISGEKDAFQELLGQQGTLLQQHHEQLMQSRPLSDMLDSYIELLRHSRSRLRFLHVGAGAASASKALLDRLAPPQRRRSSVADVASPFIAQYTIADISMELLDAAKTHLGPWSDLLDFRVLNIMDDFAAQGIPAATYDIVVASNILQSSTDTMSVLANLRQVLVPGGKVILLNELIGQSDLCSVVTYGSLPNWWPREECNKVRSPHVSIERWDQYLRQAGFSGIEVVAPNAHARQFWQTAVMISSAAGTEIIAHEARDVVLVCADREEANEVSESLRWEAAAMPVVSVVSLAELQTRENISDSILISLLERRRPALPKMDENALRQLRDLVVSCPRLLWVSGDGVCDPGFGLGKGLIRTLRAEQGFDNVNLVLLAVDSNVSNPALGRSIADIISQSFLAEPILAEHRNAEYALQDGILVTNRVLISENATAAIRSEICPPAPELTRWDQLPTSSSLVAQMTNAGTRNRETSWKQNPQHDLPLGEYQVEVAVQAVGLGRLDGQSARGESPSTALGQEAAGHVGRVGARVTRFRTGDRVMFISEMLAGQGALGTHSRVREDFAIAIPENLSFEEAAGLPVACTTALYALQHIGKLAPLDHVLVNGAAGSIGQAAVQYAIARGARVIAIVSSLDEKLVLVQEYALDVQHVLLSGDPQLCHHIRQRATDGIDILVDCDPRNDSLDVAELLKPLGCAVKLDPATTTTTATTTHGLGARPRHALPSNVSLTNLYMPTLLSMRPQLSSSLLQETVDLWAASQMRVACPRRIAPYGKLESALDELAEQGDVFGKLVLTPGTEPVAVHPESMTTSSLSADASYLLAGDLVGLGSPIAQLLARRGARYLLLMSSSLGGCHEIQQSVHLLGCRTIIIPACEEAMDGSQLQRQLLDKVREEGFPPIRGCINLCQSMPEGDVSSHEIPPLLWGQSCRAQVNSLQSLHDLLPKDLDFFVMLTCATSRKAAGPGGLANFTYAMSFADSLARHRAAQGLPATAVHMNLGKTPATIDNHHLPSPSETEDEVVLSIIDYALKQIQCPSSDSSLQLVYGLDSQPGNQLGNPMLCHVVNALSSPRTAGEVSAAAAAGAASTSASSLSFHDQIATAKSAPDAAASIAAEITNKLSELLNLPLDHITQGASVRDTGVDSMLQVEFCSWLSRALKVSVMPPDLVTQTIYELAASLAAKTPLTSFEG